MSNKSFYSHVNKYKFYDAIKDSQEKGYATKEFMIFCYTVAHKISRTFRFKSYTPDYIDSMISYSLEKCISVYTKYNLIHTESAYSFFHSTIKNSFIDHINNFYLKYFEMKKDLMKIVSIDNKANQTHYDTFFDDAFKEDIPEKYVNYDEKEYEEEIEEKEINDDEIKVPSWASPVIHLSVEQYEKLKSEGK